MEEYVSYPLWHAAALAFVVGVVAPASRAADETAPPKNPYEGRADVAEEGRGLLNQYCAHCHGPNAEQGERPRDLRRLKIRYGDDAIAVFWKTVHTGRMDKGMPVWAGVLADDTLWRIYAFLQTIQAEP
jgi:polar amino acid transport system substrate-binding protein